MVWGIAAIVLILIVWTQVQRNRRYKARRESLHQDSAGFWVWTDFDGSTRQSNTKPDSSGGAWFHESSDRGGDGFDGGGDGGGGD